MVQLAAIETITLFVTPKLVFVPNGELHLVRSWTIVLQYVLYWAYMVRYFLQLIYFLRQVLLRILCSSKLPVTNACHPLCNPTNFVFFQTCYKCMLSVM
jgi:hypothetical protein